MAVVQVPKYFVKGNLSEKQIEADVASFMGWCTPPEEDNPFRLLDIDEQATGADKLFDRGVAIYMQFKKSAGLRSARSVAPSTRKARSALEDIRAFRSQMDLQDDPTLFFQLRAKAKTALDLQHNVLRSYEQPPSSRAIYVAPLLLDKTAYHAALHASVDRFLLYPFHYRLAHTVYTSTGVSRFGAVPFLREHISIPPHEWVTDHSHYYAYSETGTDVSWHSPEIVRKEPLRLSDFTVRLLREAINNPDSMLPLDALTQEVFQIASNFGFRDTRATQRESAIESLIKHGRWLNEWYGIRQFILLGNTQTLADIRRGV